MKKSILFLLVVQFLLFTACSDDDSTPNETPVVLEAEIRLNVAYGDHPQQVYDLYLPEGRSSEKTKVIVLVHGGGWIEGDKEDMDNFISLVQQNHPNHAIVNINYVLATVNTPAFPNQFLDIDLVINQITSQQDELQVLPQFGLIGASAGAHISLQYDYVYDTDNQVKFVADIVGPSDFTDPFYSENPNFEILLGLLVDEAAYPGVTDYATAVSPALQITTNASPTIMFYGDQDPLVPLSNGLTLRNNLTASQITNSFTAYQGGHGDDWDEASLLDLQIKLSDFINEYLGIQP